MSEPGRHHPYPVLLAAIQCLCLAAVVSAEDIPTQADLDSAFAAHVRPLLDSYCVGCHNATERNGGKRLDDLAGAFTPENRPLWADVKDMLDVGSMPPKDAEKRPTRDELGLLLTWIGDAQRRDAADHQEAGGDTLMRRINLRTYATMIQTLLDVPPQGIEDFPEDVATDGFDTVGSGLYTTGRLYDLYWACARRTLDAALLVTPNPPQVRTFTTTFKKTFEPNQAFSIKECEAEVQALSDPAHYVLRDGAHDPYPTRRIIQKHYGVPFKGIEAKKIDWRQDPACMADLVANAKATLEKARASLGHLADLQLAGGLLIVKATDPGWYVITIPSLCVVDARYPVVMKLSAGSVTETFLLTDPIDSPRDHELRVWLNPGENRVRLCNALFGVEQFATHAFEWKWLEANYGTKVPMCFLQGVLDNFAPADKETQDLAFPARCIGIEARGPVYDHWPTTAVTRIFTRGLQAPPSREYAEEIAIAFMKRAFAGDGDAAMAKPYVDLMMATFASGHDFVAAVKLGLAGILCSPRFLYLAEQQRTDTSKRRPLAGFELARRLAAFLWSDLPDDQLLASAQSGELLRDDGLLAQTRRMLKDPRSRALREGFTTQWLKIGKLGDIPFDQYLFPAWDPLLTRSAIGESVAFFSELLDHDESILEFIDSDFAMLNQRLAMHYGIPGVSGNEFRRVPLPPGSHRGGVLGQASVLMATSNGMVTSIVRRGAFIMRQLLGVDPGSPPKNVPALDKVAASNEDGSPRTQRERLAMHRANASCARCHDKIDPLGVGLENYNAVGAFNASLSLIVTPKSGKRTWKDVPADVRGQMLDGAAYDGPEQLRQRLMEHKDQFARCFTDKLAIYALGRPLQLSDGPVLDRICASLPGQHYGLATIVDQLVLSELFRTK